MKPGRIIVITVLVVVAVFAVIVGYVYLTQGPPPVEVAKFSGGNPIASDVTVTEVFQVTEETWSIDLSSGTTFPGWSLEVELYEEWGAGPLLSLKGKWGVIEDQVIWERGPGTTGGTFIVPYEYQPDLPPGRYYLKIRWTSITWIIHIFEVSSR